MFISEFRLFERLVLFIHQYTATVFIQTSITQTHAVFPSTNNIHYFHSTPSKEQILMTSFLKKSHMNTQHMFTLSYHFLEKKSVPFTKDRKVEVVFKVLNYYQHSQLPFIRLIELLGSRRKS